MGCSMPGFPVPHQLPEFTQTHVHWVGDAIQPSHPLSSSSPAFNLSQHQGLFKRVSSSHQVAKVLEFWLFATPWTAAYKAPLSFTISQSLLKFMPVTSTISSSVVPFSCLQSFPASGSFPMSQLFASGGQSIGVSMFTNVHYQLFSINFSKLLQIIIGLLNWYLNKLFF